MIKSYDWWKEQYDKYYVQQTRERTLITSIADSYLRNRMIDEFKLLVKVQIEKYRKRNVGYERTDCRKESERRSLHRPVF